MPLVVYISFSAAVILQINSMGWVAERRGRVGDQRQVVPSVCDKDTFLGPEGK